MKMENEVHAPRAGVVGALSVSAGEAVANGQVICRIGVGGEPAAVEPG
jgi:biotin carboxyl carrier protein